MSADYQFVVPGQPQPKQRPRVVRHAGRSIAYTPPATASFELRVALASSHIPDLAGPLKVIVTAVFKRPEGKRKKGREGLMWRPRRPDVDNVGKAVLDGLSGKLEDGEVVSLWLRKVDCEIGGEPRTVVKIWRLDPEGDPEVLA